VKVENFYAMVWCYALHQVRVVIISKSQVARQVEKAIKSPKKSKKTPKSSHDRWSEPVRRERQPAWGRPGSEKITTLGYVHFVLL